MREPFSTIFDGLSDPDPTRRAQIQTKRPLPKRFYERAETAEGEGGHVVVLDGKPVRTPAKRPFALPSKALAEAAAAEWQAQVNEIDPAKMPLTRLVNTAIDGVADDPQAVAENIVRFAGSDLLCYRAGDPESLVRLQAEHWDPLLEWAQLSLGARFVLAEGVMHVEQPREAIVAVSTHLRRFGHPLQLAALHTITTLTGSAVIALAVASRMISAEEAWTAAHVDEDFNIAQWGEDAEAALRRAKRWEEMKAAAATLEAF
ncbi:MAG: ATP12 family chaperone protein [Pararhizobium sp.]